MDYCERNASSFELHPKYEQFKQQLNRVSIRREMKKLIYIFLPEADHAWNMFCKLMNYV